MQSEQKTVKGSEHIAADATRQGELVAQVVSAAAALQRALTSALPGKGLGAPQWLVVDALVRSPEGCTMSALATAVGMPAATLTRVVDGLVDRALVHRGLDGLDRRRVLVMPTDRGRLWHDELSPAVAASVDRALADLAGWERQSIVGLLQKIS